MNKHFKKILIGAILVGSIFSLTGCGGDKFEGEWVTSYIDNINEDNTYISYLKISPPYKEIKIEKDGSKYLITETEKLYTGIIKYDYQPEEKYYIKENVIQKTGTNQKDTITINGEFGTQFYTYIEKDKILQDAKGNTYRKKEKNDFEKYKENLQKIIDIENVKLSKKTTRYPFSAGKLTLAD